MSKIKKFFSDPGQLFVDLARDPLNQFKALTSGDLTQTGKALFAPSLITQQTPGALADSTRLADTIVAGYFGGPAGVAGAESLHKWNEGASIGDALTSGATSGLMSYLGGTALKGLGNTFGPSASDSMSGVTTEAGYGGAPMSVPTSGLESLTKGTGLSAGGGASAVGGSGMNLSDALKLGGSIYSGISSQDTTDEMKKQIERSLSPYTQAGAAATGQLSDALKKGFNYQDYANSPAYQFQLGEGQKALTSRLASQGLGQSGAAVKAATDYATNLANQNYGDAYNQWLQKNQQLSGLSGIGSGAATNLGSNQALLTGAGQNAMNEMVSNVSQNELVKALLNKTGMFT